MYCISINHKNAAAEIRSRFAFSRGKRQEISAALSEHGIKQSVIVCTCNRTELYFIGSDIGCTDTAAEILTKYSGEEPTSVSLCLRSYYGEKALAHLFRVACGIDSMIIGEDEILRQVKDAYAESHENGFTDFELNTIFQSAITCAKRIKTDTALSKTPVSAATLAANKAASLGGSVNVLVIGASGKIGTSALKNLLSHKNVSVTATMRSKGLGADFHDIRTVPYPERYRFADEADCIISATASPHYTLTARALGEALKTAKPRLLIDLAVPHDIEKAVKDIEGIRLMDIDDFAKLAEHNNSIRLSSAEEAETIIAGDIDELQKRLSFRRFMPYMADFSQQLDSMGAEGLLYRLRDNLTSAQFSAVLEALVSMQ